MKREDAEKLLGGYATGNLSPEEQRALFEAALEDPELFESVADESALKELLDDPGNRRLLLEALPARHKSFIRRWPVWSWAAAGAVAASVVVGIALMRAPEPMLEFSAAKQPVPDMAKTAAPTPPAKQAIAQAPAAPRAQLTRRLNEPQRQNVQPALSDLQAEPKVKQEVREVKTPVERLDEKARAKTDAAAATGVESSAQAVAPSPLLETVVADRVAPMSAASVVSARELFYGATRAKSGFLARAEKRRALGSSDQRSLPALGIRYTISRRDADGKYTVVNPETRFHTGDAVRLTFESNTSGTLSISDGTATLANLAVIANTRYVVPSSGALEMGGSKTLRLSFAAEQKAGMDASEVAKGPLVQRTDDNVTYVVTPAPAARLSFEITLAHE
jgi:hypothetical protein